MKKITLCLMGPTAAGKTDVAIAISQRFPCDIISVDSAMVYRGMDIGTAKPDATVLQHTPHRLLDIRDPRDAYSAGQFSHDAQREITDIFNKQRIPLLVGGTMLYFRALQRGLADLPIADPAVRLHIATQAQTQGWPALHAQLQTIDSIAAQRIHPHDAQRIQRALEIYETTGQTLSTLWKKNTVPLATEHTINVVLAPQDRSVLHQKIADRFNTMLARGFIDEVKKLMLRGDLSADLPSMRSVGYRQAWRFLTGELDYNALQTQAMAATRQLAKRQLTWLRSWPNCHWFDSEDPRLLEKIVALIAALIDAK